MKITQRILSIVLLTFIFQLNTAQAQVKNLAPSNFAQVVKSEKATVVDVRTQGEVQEGYIKGTTVFANINSNDFNAQIDKLDKSKTYVVYCRSGGRSSRAASIMVSKGFKNVYNLNGGILSWSGEVIKP
ncbi:MAG: rhodanese-like domain-containing protein [bacterium]|nr:rhodanese-like domain-containing protein [bacterium]